jgi:hypothetical protein
VKFLLANQGSLLLVNSCSGKFVTDQMPSCFANCRIRICPADRRVSLVDSPLSTGMSFLSDRRSSLFCHFIPSSVTSLTRGVPSRPRPFVAYLLPRSWISFSRLSHRVMECSIIFLSSSSNDPSGTSCTPSCWR